ncbi:nucleotidyltransferase domain-containing protein [Deinococcus aquiradiocola]|uniref:Nucleotidyltransferase n=1 Tax=Deinococcus aquiradiocola TaxID=393059 RepID=A0A917P9S1_9DEIO|nr:nucleotidyltransferase domain-containing protein [Deinococcus aquiradiocola]GGJ67942.1 nucleotidyltransferase [Deinococcus aquiradiocola]
MNGETGVLPVGTRVVTRSVLHTPAQIVLHPAGTLGVVVRAPTAAPHTYRVQFPDGSEHSFLRRQLSLHREQGNLVAPQSSDLWAQVQLRVVVGSRAFGLDTDTSDTDRRGFWLPTAAQHWALWGVPEQLENEETQETYWELQKFLTLALKANPNILEVLYSPLVEHATPLAEELLAMRSAFLSTLVYQTYNSYVMGQFKRLEADLRNHGEIRWKHAMHLLRLLLSGLSVLQEGEVLVHVGEHRSTLLAVKRGEVPWDELNAWRLDLHRQMAAAVQTTRLPERPDAARVNAFLIRARTAMLEHP